MPVALISTRTSPAFGPSRSSSTISSGFLASKATAARVFIREYPSHCRDRQASSRSTPSLFPHAGIFRLGVGLGLVFPLGRAPTPDGVVGTGTQIDVQIVH